MKKIYYLFSIVFFVVAFLTVNPAYAAAPSAPINGNISYLVIAGMALGVVALFRLKKLQPKH